MKNKEKIIQILINGGIGILPTDTLYGLVGSALNQQAVERIYKVKRRRPDKPFIILISQMKDLAVFDVKINSGTKEKLSRIWPAKVSVILPCASDKFKYLHRGGKALAFRLTEFSQLNDIIKKTGPLVAPSANIEGQDPAKIIEQARQYFTDEVDFYEDVGRLESDPSTLIRVNDEGNIEILREGVDLEKIKNS